MQKAVKKDQEQLKLLAIFYYILGGLTAAFSFLPLFHVIIGIVMLVKQGLFVDKKLDIPFFPFIGWIFITLGISSILLWLAYATSLICAGNFLIKKKHYLFCLVVACLTCVSFPFGTTLGILTIVVINRNSVKEQFNC